MKIIFVERSELELVLFSKVVVFMKQTTSGTIVQREKRKKVEAQIVLVNQTVPVNLKALPLLPTQVLAPAASQILRPAAPVVPLLQKRATPRANLVLHWIRSFIRAFIQRLQQAIVQGKVGQ